LVRGANVGAGGTGGSGGTGIIERDSLSTILAAGGDVLVLTALVAEKSRRRCRLVAGARIEEGVDEREQMWETSCCPAK
jgi:hypothetical protein